MSLSNLIDIATDEKQTEDNWAKIIDVCEKGSSNSKECLKLILRRLFNRNPHIVLRSIILLDACVQNIGESFTKELSSRYFVNEIKSKSKNIHQKALERLCFMMKKWSRELKGSEYDCISELNKWLQETYPVLYAAGDDELNSRNSIKNSQKNIIVQEDDDLAKAIALSLKESEQKRQTNIYPTNIVSSTSNSIKAVPDSGSTAAPKKQLPKVRALYDFEAAEDNELTFKAGEIIIDVDTSNEHWWFGSNHRGQGMFPAQFVTTDLDNDIERSATNNIKLSNETTAGGTSSQQIEVFPARPPTPVIDESKVDECLLMIEDADPTGEVRPDPPELSKLEAQCRVMGPLIDQELEKVDRHYNMLVELNRKTIESFQLYNDLMTQGGMVPRQINYMWPYTTYPGMTLPPPQDITPTTISQPSGKDRVSAVGPSQIQDPVMFHHPMNYYGNIGNMPNQEMMYANAMQQHMQQQSQQFPHMSLPPLSSLAANASYPIPPSAVNKQQINYPPNNPANNNSASTSNLGFTDHNMRSLPVQQNNYTTDNTFQSVTNGNQPNYSYVQNDQAFH